MNVDELFSAFRSDVVDTELPYLWSDDEVYRYMDGAYKTFVRSTGGIPDATSDITQIPVVAGEHTAEISPLILRIRDAFLVSTGRRLVISNIEEIAQTRYDDYGALRPMGFEDRPGPVTQMVIGMDRNKERGTVRWLMTPVENDTVSLVVYRLPTVTINETVPNYEFDDIGEEHHQHLLLGMKALAYGKQDAETFDRGKRDTYAAEFRAYCETARAEWERYKHKTRIVSYGGI